MAENHTPTLITQTHPKSAAAEAFRTLRTNISFSALDRPVQSLLVTSAGPGEGKSTTTCNLAVVMAQTGSRVLVLDCDLRKPTMHKVFDLDNRRGLTSVLVEGLDPAEVISPTLAAGLSVLTSGPLPPNPAELLGSGRMRDLLARLVAEHDIVLIDTPPVLAVTDAAVLAPQVDAAVLVARAGVTRLDMMQEAKTSLGKTGVHLLGAVLNGLRPESDGYYYYYHYKYYYGQHNGEGNNRG
ncbi:MAG: polysaccharide biosynthesis tyrosine autokinase [Clostridia bacterium]|nr:MAG: polysaccharide biosynthesis tyrosine autokinase [Clostridia bacterium]